MSIADDIKARYNRSEVVTDSLGRSFTVRPLRTTEAMKIHEMTESTKPEVVSMLLAAASVRAIEGTPISFPKTRPEIDSVVDMLDEEGFAAVGEGLRKLDEKSPAPKSEAEFTAAAGE